MWDSKHDVVLVGRTLSRRRDSMLVALWIALDNGLHIPPIAWVLFGFEVVDRLLNWWLKD